MGGLPARQRFAGLSLKTIAAIARSGSDHDMVWALACQHGVDILGRDRTPGLDGRAVTGSLLGKPRGDGSVLRPIGQRAIGANVSADFCSRS